MQLCYLGIMLIISISYAKEDSLRSIRFNELSQCYAEMSDIKDEIFMIGETQADTNIIEALNSGHVGISAIQLLAQLYFFCDLIDIYNNVTSVSDRPAIESIVNKSKQRIISDLNREQEYLEGTAPLITNKFLYHELQKLIEKTKRSIEIIERTDFD